MNDSTITIRTVGFRCLCRGYFRVLFSGLYSRKGANLSPPVVGLGPFWVLVDLFTGLVVPTTCSSLLVLYYGSSGKWGGGNVVGTFRIPNLLPVRLSI